MKKAFVSPLQIWTLFVGTGIGANLIFSPGVTFTQQDAWLGPLFAGTAGLVYVPLLTGLRYAYPGQSLVIAGRTACGKITGTLLAFFWVWFPLHLYVLALMNISYLLSHLVYPNTPPVVFNLLAAIVTGYAAWLGPEVIARFTVLILPWLLAGLAGLTVLTLPTIDYLYFLPVGQTSFGDFARQGLGLFAFPFSESVLLVAFLAHVPLKTNLNRTLLSSFITVSLVLSLVTTLMIGTLGPGIIADKISPLFSVVRYAGLGHYLDRLDAAFMPVWLGFVTIKMALCLYIFSRHLSEWAGFTGHRLIVPPAALLGLGFSLVFLKNLVEGFVIIDKVYFLYLVPWALGYPILLLLLAKYRRRQKAGGKQAALKPAQKRV
ncbi:MAG: endospore germination permease [Heliobacteriaceae bacterium]|nr:endospore germination permease [Heliobacteriaceae bacterium]